MSKLIVQNAEIKTAAVEVKTLTISGKQVTLAVFRQLKEVELVDHDGALKGTPWGSVNYHPDKCADSSSHLHIVWQFGTELRRAMVKAPKFGQRDVFVDGGTGAAWLDVAITDGWRPDGDRVMDYLTVSFGTRPLAAYIRVDAEAQKALWPARTWDGKVMNEVKLSAALDEIRNRVSTTRDIAAASIAAELDAEQARRERHHARWRELLDLPQLFIAV